MFRYYVYELIDPRDDSVFYVGKGTGAGVSRKNINKIMALNRGG